MNLWTGLWTGFCKNLLYLFGCRVLILCHYMGVNLQCRNRGRVAGEILDGLYVQSGLGAVGAELGYIGVPKLVGMDLEVERQRREMSLPASGRLSTGHQIPHRPEGLPCAGLAVRAVDDKGRRAFALRIFQRVPKVVRDRDAPPCRRRFSRILVYAIVTPK